MQSLADPRPQFDDVELLVIASILLQHRDARLARRNQELTAMTAQQFETSIASLDKLIAKISPMLARCNGLAT